jgi:hypothetical protein
LNQSELAAMKITKLRVVPKPVWLIELQETPKTSRLPFEPISLLVQLDESKRLIGSSYRAVELKKLELILKTGVDMEPAGATIYTTGFFDKCWEYGEWPKVVMAFNKKLLDRTYREVDAKIRPEELAELKVTFPTERKTHDGSQLWLSRLGPDHPQIAGSYEREYAHWIPGDSFEALNAVMIFYTNGDNTAETAISLLDSIPRWQ